MGFPAELFVQQPVSDDLLCSICRDVHESPSTACSNGHVFCGDCIQQWLAEGINESFCPVCRNDIDESSLSAHQHLQEAIFGMKVRCPMTSLDIKNAKIEGANSSKGIKFAACCNAMGDSGMVDACSWEGTLSDYVNVHLVQECKFTLINCSKCKEKVIAGEMEHHMKDICLCRPVHCEFCHNQTTMDFMEKHLNDFCLENPICCQHCGLTMAKLALAKHHSVCNKIIIDCPFKAHGCKAQHSRETMEGHLQRNIEAHCEMLNQGLAGINDKLARLETSQVQNTWQCVEFTWNIPDHRVNEILGDGLRSETVMFGPFKTFAKLQAVSEASPVDVIIGVEDSQHRLGISNISVQTSYATRRDRHYFGRFTYENARTLNFGERQDSKGKFLAIPFRLSRDRHPSEVFDMRKASAYEEFLFKYRLRRQQECVVGCAAGSDSPP